MLETIATVLLVINILIILFAILSEPTNKKGYGAMRPDRPATLAYDVNDFCAYYSHLVLRPFEEGGARFIFNCQLDEDSEPIDMIMLAKSGVYVFEHVQATGWITGMENNEKWTERIQMGYGRKPQEEKFPNPVRIAEDNVHTVRKFLALDDVLVRSVIVFPDFCLLNNIKVFNPNTRIVTLNQLLPAMVTLNNKTGINITQRDINLIYDRLAEYEVYPDDETNE
ncbi:MAG: NERD domain-containing protein [Ruminococcaceae bacterium]|nr:NERD domain-containing protein [Oscillospiraceae bacterium]